MKEIKRKNNTPVFGIVLFFVVFSLIFAPNVNAQYQEKAIEYQKQTCGNANPDPKYPDANKCCSINLKSMYEKEQEGANSVIPSGLGSFFFALGAIFLPVLDQNPAVQFMQRPCYSGVPEGAGASCKCVNTTKIAADAPQLSKLCEANINPVNAKYSDAEKKRYEQDRNACLKCAVEEGGFYSDLGCIPGNLAGFITDFVLRIGIGIAGFIALMCIIYSSFLLQVSRGNPEMITKAREQITSCIIGLLMIIFSVFILRLIGVDILKIPGFS